MAGVTVVQIKIARAVLVLLINAVQVSTWFIENFIMYAKHVEHHCLTRSGSWYRILWTMTMATMP